MKRTLTAICVIFGVLLVTNCDNPSGASTSIPIETIEYSEDGNGAIQFKTNDSTKYGWTYWSTISGTNETVLSTVIINYNKKSGASHWPLGAMFCYEDASNHRTFLVTKNGSYTIREKTPSSYDIIRDYTYSSYVNTGYDVENTLKIEYDSPNEDILFYINNNLVESIGIDEFSSTRLNGYSGFVTCIGDEDGEDFPSTPVDARFKMLSPITAP